MGRIIALDFGSKTTGIAMTDPTATIASPLETVKREKDGKLRPTLRRICELVRENDIKVIVIGLPLNMDGSRGERAVRSEEFAALLRKRLASEDLAPEIVLWDERLTTVEADELLDEAGVQRTDRKQYIDKIAAAIILEDYMAAAGGITVSSAPIM